MQVRIEDSWKKVLQPEFEKPYFKDLTNFVRNAYTTTTCYPKGSKILSAFDFCKWDELKVVILGQDPYHGLNQAHGLCFSVSDGIPHPPSLINIFKEIETDLGNAYPKSGNLEHWAQQGVLLLNATLTVEAGLAGSHQKQGWETFTDAVIQNISSKRVNVVFLLWGGFAKKKIKLIDTSKHHVLTSGHPSPLSANRGYWFGNKHFSQTNQILKNLGESEINW